jgi:hypothetical protein
LSAVVGQNNEIDLSLALLTQLKIKHMSVDLSTLPLDGIYYQNEDELDQHWLTIVVALRDQRKS